MEAAAALAAAVTATAAIAAVAVVIVVFAVAAAVALVSGDIAAAAGTCIQSWCSWAPTVIALHIVL